MKARRACPALTSHRCDQHSRASFRAKPLTRYALCAQADVLVTGGVGCALQFWALDGECVAPLFVRVTAPRLVTPRHHPSLLAPY